MMLLSVFFITVLGGIPAGDVIAKEGAKAEATEKKKKKKKIVSNKKCHKCHSDEDEKYETLDDDEETKVYIYVDEDKFKESVHGKQNCVGCHTNIVKKYHQERPEISVSCITCHQDEYDKQLAGEGNPKYKRLDVVVDQVDDYMHSVHARPSIADQSVTNATCYDCHDPHNVGAPNSDARVEYRLKNHEVCGQCHEEQKKDYLTSVHGQEIVNNKNSDAAVCSDCHSRHRIDSPEKDTVQLAITGQCGTCHEKALETYQASYHGQVNRLGYTNTAGCSDCHGSHKMQKSDDPTSMVHMENRLETCQTCHEDATEGFLSYQAHADGNDKENYPVVYWTTKFMTWLIIGVFAFFWTHVILWFYRELRDRQQGKVHHEETPAGADQVYVRRFSAVWRWIHFLFAGSTMVLILSGSTLLFSHTAWAPFVINLLGGPEAEAIIHRTAGVIWLTVFMAHFVIAMYNIFKNRKTFRWFGPTSMIPNWQDMYDVIAMFKWFFGFAERPSFDRWSYWQKFDYWAPFWGAAIIGFSGLSLFAATFSAQFVPGWIFNIATIIHAEEAILATIFLFTVHFFNAHFRPDRFPMSTTIFTGSITLEEFKHEHALEYKRLQESGELEKHLVKKPSRSLEIGSNMLGVTMILAGLGLLTLVLIGYTTM